MRIVDTGLSSAQDHNVEREDHNFSGTDHVVFLHVRPATYHPARERQIVNRRENAALRVRVVVRQKRPKRMKWQ